MIRCRAAVLACALYAGNVLGHATLVASEPGDGAVLARQPAEIVLRFDEAVTPIAVRLLDDTGASVPLGDAPSTQGEAVRVKLPAALKIGSYWMSYRVTSSDSHPVAGAITFSIGPRSQASTPAPQAVEALAHVDIWPRIVVRALQDLAVAVCAGGALFALWIAPLPRARLVVGTSALVAMICAAAGIWTQGAALLGGGVNLLGSEAWRVGLASTRGTSAGIVVAGTLAVAAGAFRASGAMRTGLICGGGALLIASACVTGHPATMQPRALAVGAIGIHVVAAMFWAGSLVALLMLVSEGPVGRAVLALQRFSRYAVIPVAGLAVAGVLLAAFELGWPPAFFDGAYGSLVIAKSALFAALLAFACWNRFRLVPDLARGHPLAGQRVAASIGAELMLIALAIAAAAALSQTSPPHAAPAARREVVETLTTPTLAARLSIVPARSGSNVFTIRFTAAGGAAADPSDVALEFANPKAGAEAIVRRPVRVAPGEYRWTGGELAFAGEWSIAIRARVSEFDVVRFDTTVKID